ncbi:MAG: DUF3298 and DUF4163 domain-containing protein [Bacteroidia bacterium]
MRYLAIIFICFALNACGNQQEKTQVQEPPEEVKKVVDPALVFSIESIDKHSKSCATDSNSCATVDITVPLAKGTEAADPINARVTGALVSALNVGETRATGLNEGVDGFVNGYDAFLAEMKAEGQDYINSWAFEAEGQVLYQDSQYVCIEMQFYTYTGGAHPNSFTSLLTFNSKTGEEVNVLATVADTVALKVKVQEAFRLARKLPKDAVLQEEGFFWGGKFAFPANIGITAEGLYFVYNPYEVAPYALGSTGFVVTEP